MSEGEMAFMLAFQLLESVGKLTKLFEQLAKRPTVIHSRDGSYCVNRDRSHESKQQSPRPC